MTSSYLVIGVDPELVPRDELADLLDLIWLCHPTPGLQVDDLFQAVPREYVVPTADPLIKAKPTQQPHELGKANVRIPRPLRTTRNTLRIPPIVPPSLR